MLAAQIFPFTMYSFLLLSSFLNNLRMPFLVLFINDVPFFFALLLLMLFVAFLFVFSISSRCKMDTKKGFDKIVGQLVNYCIVKSHDWKVCHYWTLAFFMTWGLKPLYIISSLRFKTSVTALWNGCFSRLDARISTWPK